MVKAALTVEGSNMSDIRQEVEDYFKKKGTYSKYEKDGSLARRIAKGVHMAKKARGIKDEPKSKFHPENLERKEQDLLSDKLVELSKKYNVEPHKLEQLMLFESGGTLDPTKKSGTSSARGLIQFMPSTLKDLGSSTEEAIKMSASEQMGLVDKYFEKKLKGVESPTDSDLYMSILYPKAVSKDEGFVLFSEGSNAYEANKGLDKDNDGNITKEEASSKAYSIGSSFQNKKSLLRQVGERRQQEFNEEADIEASKQQSEFNKKAMEANQSKPLSPMKTLQEPVKEEKEKRDSIREMKLFKNVNLGIYK